MNKRSRTLEAMLLAAPDGSISFDVLSETFGRRGLEEAVARLASDYSGRGLVIQTVDGHVQIRTDPESRRFVEAVLGATYREMSPAVLQTLAMIALYGPCTRSEIEAVRGVRLSPGVLERCLETGCVSPGPRRQDGGRAMTWQVTRRYYEMFDLDPDTVASFDAVDEPVDVPLEFVE